MPFKLIGTIILLVIVTIFCGFNLGEENRCDINFIFHTLKDVPAFLTVIVSFFCGVLVMIPFTFKKQKLTKEQIVQAAEKQKNEEIKNREKAEKKRIKAEQKEKTLAEKTQKKELAEKAKKNAKANSTSKNDVPIINKTSDQDKTIGQ